MFKKFLRLMFSGELFLALFLFSGFFKEELTFLPSFLDITILFGILTLIVVLKRLYEKPFITYKMFLGIAFYFFIFSLMLLSTFYTTSEVYAQEKIIKYITITAGAFFGALFLIRTPTSLKRFLYGVILIGVGMSAGLFFWVDYSGTGAMYIDNYASIGRSAGISLVTALCLVLLEGETLKSKVVGVSVILLLSFSLLASGVRMPLIAAFFSLILIFFSSFKIKNNVIYYNKGLKWFLGIGIIALLLALPFLRSEFFQRSFNRFMILLNIDGGEDPTGRIDRFATAFDMFYESPLLGKGVGSFAIDYSGVDSTNYPHNLFLEILSELGFIGFAAFSLMIIIIFVNLFVLKKFSSSKNSVVIIALFATFLYTFLNANVAGDINDNRILFSFMAISFSLTTSSVFKEIASGEESKKMTSR